MPGSNFHPELEISDDGTVIKIGGPLEQKNDDADLVSVVVSAFVTQEPERRVSPPAVQQGATGAGSVELAHADLTLAENGWEFSVESEGGAFREGWAFASAELLGKASDGSIEKYTWSQWVWLRHP
ncbi:MAG: hypothetical protein QOJ47_1163 [Gaiellales bacterium]|nr:hypothetical protein [Gaiellales bacterium]